MSVKPVREDSIETVAFENTPRRTYEPRITFYVRHLTEDQKNSLRTVTHILRMLEGRVRAAGSIREAAKQMGVSKSFLWDVLHGKRPPGYRLARAVGFVPKVLYMRVFPGDDFPESIRTIPEA